MRQVDSNSNILTPTVPSSLLDPQQLRTPLGEFSWAWNKEITCRTSCEFYQYRLIFIDHIKVVFLHKFQELLDSHLQPHNGTHILKTHTLPKGTNPDEYIEVSVGVVIGNETCSLLDPNPRAIFDNLQKTKDPQLVVADADPHHQDEKENVTLSSFGKDLQQLFLNFVVQSFRNEPILLKENEEASQTLHSFSLRQLQKVKANNSIKYELNLIDKSPNTLDTLLRLVESPGFSKYFNMVRVYDGQRLKYIYKEPIGKSQHNDSIVFQERNFTLEGFRKHIAYLIPFWFTLEMVFQSDHDEQSYCEVVMIPPLFDSEQSRSRLNERVKSYIINLLEAVNTKVLLLLMEKTHLCPSSPYELFINQKQNALMREKSHNAPKSKSSQAPLKDLEEVEKAIFKVPFLNTSAYPLYERFADGNGLDNIKKSQLWREFWISNLEDTYVMKFKEEVFVISFKEVLPFRDKKHLPESVKNRKLLIYEVYGLELGVSREDFDLEFRRRIRQAQLYPLLNKISQHLIKAPQFLSESEVGIFQRGKQQSFRIKVPYMSCYGVYLCYLKQKLNFTHRKTSRKRHQQNFRKYSTFEHCCDSFRDEHNFTSFIEDNNNFQSYEYFYNEQDEMLFLFNYAAARGNEDEPFGNCIYLLDIALLSDNAKMEEITEYIDREPVSSQCRKKSFFIHGVDPSETKGNRFKELKELMHSLNEIFPLECSTIQKRDSDVLSNSSGISSDMVNDYDKVEPRRAYQNVEIECKFQIIGNEDFDSIQKYCQTQIEGTYCDYLVEGMVSRLKKMGDDYINLDIQLMSKKKRKIHFDDIQPIVEENLNHLLPLSRMNSMKNSLTIFNYKSEHMNIHQPRHLYTLLVELAKNLFDRIYHFLGCNNKRPEVVYYVMNSHRRLICYGCLSKLVVSGSQDHQVFLKSLNKDGEVGLLFGSHISYFFEKIEEEKKKSEWIQGIKQYPDGKFFGTDAFYFKRNFLIHLAITSEGIMYFSYNVNRNINFAFVKNMEMIAFWSIEKKLLLDTLVGLKEGEKVILPKRSQMKPSLFIQEDWDPYRQLITLGQKEKKKKPKPLSLTQLFKNMVFQLMPPMFLTECLEIKVEEINRIYELLMNQKMDFSKYGDLPKNLQYKCELSRLGFQVLSILRYNYIREVNRKQEEEDI